jgi:hypothetical protein
VKGEWNTDQDKINTDILISQFSTTVIDAGIGNETSYEGTLERGTS